ncbi:uncharacterized protein LOC113212674 [Frankliniella occidentalis]|uniref:Uncharacterized protein LOC113212674 n=1 Tax=Frankliniella occidentalis TaxID=133901 RepID=A0A6J1T6H0_FRAOC|nr:uncharacterized protein LOC113212674 [Frankliniella occidentalis]
MPFYEISWSKEDKRHWVDTAWHHLLVRNSLGSYKTRATMIKLACTLVVLVAVASWCPPTLSASEIEPGSAPASQTLFGPDCQILSGSLNGYVAVANQAAGKDVAGPRAGLRTACSSSDNNSCNVQCINSGWRGGYCCCTCGTVSLCTCYR